MLIPVGVDVPITRPWVNYILVAATVVISIAGFYDEAVFEVLHVVGLSSLLHAGWLHLAGNMLFLWVFGNAVNYKFGHLGYVGLYAASAVVADLVHLCFSGTGVQPVGASGAVYGVMGAFLVFFPRNDVRMMLWIWTLVRFFSVSSIWMIILWVGWDVITLCLGMEGRIAIWAHIGGFLLGFLVGLFCAKLSWIKPEEDEETLLQMLSRRKHRGRTPTQRF